MTRPAIFADLSLAAALQEASAQGRLLLVDATAAWCGPCQVMDRTTWVDPAVVEVVHQSALAIQVDVDAEPETKALLQIQAMPTVVAFRDGSELDRVVGMQSADKLLRWLDGLRRGETSLDRARAEAAAKPSDMMVRLSLARSLLQSGRLEEATTHYVWLWEHMLEHAPAMLGVRHSFLLREIQQLVSQHGPAREAFLRLREAAAPPAQGQPAREARMGLMDWFSLNEVFQDVDASVAWFDSVRRDLELDDQLAKILETRLVPLLVQADRWADAASLYPHPLVTLAAAAAMVADAGRDLPAHAPPGVAEQFRAFAMASLRETARKLVRALTAAGRHDEARAVREEARRVDASPEMHAAVGEGGAS